LNLSYLVIIPLPEQDKAEIDEQKYLVIVIFKFSLCYRTTMIKFN